MIIHYNQAIRLICVLSAFVVPVFVSADSTHIDLADFIIYEDESSQSDFQELINSPINLNDASIDDLCMYPFLTDTQISELSKILPVRYMNDVKKVLGKETYNLFRPYFYLAPPEKWFHCQFVSRLATTLQPNNGLRGKIYRGSPYDLYSRFRCSAGDNITAGILIQKDVGESLLYDHTSGFLSWSGWSDQLQIIAGSFTVHAGQGLVYSSPYGIQKSALAISALRTRRTSVRPYLTANESGGFWGGCMRTHIKNQFSVTLLYSSALRDATVNREAGITGISLTGLHRTPAENYGKNALTITSYGIVAEYLPAGWMTIGATGLKTIFSPPLSAPYTNSDDYEKRKNYFRFTGQNIQLGSFFWTLKTSMLIMSGECATNHFNSAATFLSARTLSNNWQFGLHWWHLPRDFSSPEGRTFSSQSAFPAAEQGIYLAMSGNIFPELRIDFYWNPVKQLWRSYFLPLPVQKADFLCNAEYRFSRNTRLTLRYQEQIREEYNTISHSFFLAKKRRIRLQSDHRISKDLLLRTRFSSSQLAANPQNISRNGMSFFQEIHYGFLRYLKMIFRFTSFKTTGYDTRIFEVEHDLAGVSSLAALWGSGYRWYILLKAKFFQGFALSIKYRRLYLDDKDSTGSGYDTINSNLREDLKIQMEYKM